MNSTLSRYRPWQLLPALVFLLLCLTSDISRAECSDEELAAVFVVDNIYPAGDPEIRLLDVASIGPHSNPTIEEMIEAVIEVQPAYPPFLYEHRGQAGPFHLFYAEPGDVGASAVVDGRDGRVVFYGTVVWLGFGSVTLPAVSDDPWAWSFPPGDPAPLPVSVGYLPNTNWFDAYGTPEEITDAVLTYLRDSDVLKSYGACGPYDVVSYIYTPIGNPGVEPYSASLIVIVSGECGPPWNRVVTAANDIPAIVADLQVAPNPFNPQTTISFALGTESSVQLHVVDLRGRLVSTLIDQSLPAGHRVVNWNGTDDSGRDVPSGIYLSRLEIDGVIAHKKMALVR